MADELHRIMQAYREERRLGDARHAKLWQRIEDSVRAGEVGPTLPPQRAAAARWRAHVVASIAVLAVAAAVVFAFDSVRSMRASVRPPASAARHDSASSPVGGVASPTDRRAAAVPRDRDRAVAESEPRSDRASDQAQDKIARPPAPTAGQQPRASRRSLAPLSEGAIPNVRNDLQREMAVLESAESTLKEGNPNLAIAKLEQHERAFPNGQLAEDRMALRVRALCELGKPAQAHAEARILLRRYPDTPHAERLRAGCPSP